VHHYLYKLRDGAIPVISIGGRNVLLRDKEFSTTLTIGLDELEEIGFRRFLTEAPRAILTQLEAQLGDEITIRREGLGWQHLVFCDRYGVQCFIHGHEDGFALSAVLFLSIGISPMPPDHVSGMDLVMGPTPSFPFLFREIAELPSEEDLAENLSQESFRGMARLVEGCFYLGMPPEGGSEAGLVR